MGKKLTDYANFAVIVNLVLILLGGAFSVWNLLSIVPALEARVGKLERDFTQHLVDHGRVGKK